MSVTLSMPQLGETVTEGTILRWLKQPGETVSEDEPVLEISTDKVDTEIPSPAAGVLEQILVQEGETVSVGTELAVIGDGSSVAQTAPTLEPEAQPAPAGGEPASTSPVPAAPLAEPPNQPAAPSEGAAPSPFATANATTVTMPQLGETVVEGTILRWAKQPGDAIAEDETLLELSTDKVDTELPSPVSGIVTELLVAEGDVVPVGAALAVIAAATGGESAPPAAPQPAAAVAPQDPPVAAPVPASPAPASPAPAAAAASTAFGPQSGPGNGMRKVLSPVVRRLAREAGVDLGLVPGTGSGGRITRQDLEAYLAAGPPAVAAPVPSQPAPAAATPTAASPAAAPVAVAAARTGTVVPPPPAAPQIGEPAETVAPPEGVPILEGDHIVELSRLRNRIAQNMIKAKQTAAHVWASVEVDYENVERVRQAHKTAWKASEGYSLTYLPFIARATVEALAAFPVVNSSIYPEQGKAVYHRAINLGVAIDLDQQGLVVGTVHGAEALQVVGLARGIRAVAEKARSNSLEPDDVSGSTFSITNPGPFGSFMTAPIINVPNTGILSTDTVTKRPVVVTDDYGTDSIAIHHIGYLGLTWDHRAFDGSTAVLFLQRIKQSLETWDWEQELA